MRPLPLMSSVLLAALLAGCGTEPAPAAAPAPIPTPSPTPVAEVFDASAVQAAYLTAAEGPAGYVALTPDLGGGIARESVALCEGGEGATAPAVPTTPSVSLQGSAGFDALTQYVVVLPDEAAAIALQAAAQRHAATCPLTMRREFALPGSAPTMQESTLQPVVPFSSGQWKGVRQTSASSFTGRKRTQRWSTENVVLRRGNAVLDLEVAGESAPPDLTAVLTAALAKLDATL